MKEGAMGERTEIQVGRDKMRRQAGTPGGRRAGAGFLAALILIGSALLLSGYSSLAERVFDQADLLDAADEEALQEDIERLTDEVEMDIVIVTVEDAQGKSAQEYADDFYDEGKFGYAADGETGILFLIDMDHREGCISTAGHAIEAFTDGEIEDMLDDIYPWLAEGRYDQACAEFLRGVKTYGTNAQVAENGRYDENTGRFEEYTPEEQRANRRAAVWKKAFGGQSILIHLGISAGIGAIAVLVMIGSVRNHKPAGGRAYIRPGSEHMKSRSDVKVNTTVVTRHIEEHRDGGGRGPGGGHVSTTHTSRSGSSHGGGSRRF